MCFKQVLVIAVLIFSYTHLSLNDL